MGVAFNHGAIHKRAGVAFVGIANKVFGGDVFAGDVAPFVARGVASPATAAQLRRFNHLHHLAGSQGEGAFPCFVAIVG